MRVRSHAESTKNAANRVQSDSDKLAIFWINQPETDPDKLSPQRRTPPKGVLEQRSYRSR